ncbi:LacI family DNA-binding transcriptional regulator [Geminicoccus roseus]|uniref:LacI family DNA-binding transcriptional regulator n=1 Tax=Geminicoccus roseus TaxID=404900 RepID=UPI0012F8ACBB|nr:LacI family DNA-binding transcriptional regulator [Geminicoccus roseus]
MAGIHDVARAAGVSASTVSNVLNGRDHRMRPETKARVLAAIKSLSYLPNVSAQQLKSGHSSAIGLIVPSTSNPFWGAVAHQVERAALALGYKVLICNAEREPAAEVRYAETLLASGVRGVILGSAPMSFEHFQGLAERGMVVAAFDRRSAGAESVVACSVTMDQELAGALATQHLIGLGHRRIAFISGPIATSSRIGRLAGIKTALARAGIPFDPSLVWQGRGISGFGDTEGSQLGRVAIRELLSRDDRPTAAITVNDMYAFGAYAGARDLGFRIPDDLSIVGFDDIVLSEIVQPALTTIRQPIATMAEAIVARLIRGVEGEAAEEGAEAHLEIKAELIVRASTAPAPTAQRRFDQRDEPARMTR